MIDPHSKVSLSILYGRPSNALSLGLNRCRRLAKDSKISPETRSLFSTSPRSSHAQKALSELMNFSDRLLNGETICYVLNLAI